MMTYQHNSSRSRRKGQIIVLLTLALSLLISMSAIAFDLAYAYVVKTLLVTSVDATALAGIRALPQGIDAVDAAMTRTFDGNFPSGLLMSTSRTLDPPAVTTIPGGRRIAITAEAEVPMFFARWLGVDDMTVRASAATMRRDRNIMLVLDYSGSVEDELPEIKVAAKAFVDTFDPQLDQIGLAAFSTMGGIEYAPQFNFGGGMHAAIDNIQTEVYTNSAAGLYWAYQALVDLADPMAANKLNSIVFFTDGVANWFPGTFEVRTGPGNCSTPVVTGSRGIGGGKYIRLLQLHSPPAPISEWPWAPGCESANDDDEKVDSVHERWYPASGVLPQGVSINGMLGTPSPTGMNSANLQTIAANMQVNMANEIREDLNLNVMVNAIGYGGVNQQVMHAVANTDSSPVYNPDRSRGIYVYASSVAELMDAFRAVASSVGRLVQ